MTPDRRPITEAAFREAEDWRLRLQLRASYAERLRDLEELWDFNEMIWARNPRIRRIVERLRSDRAG